jgi:hypothetical protein
MHCKGGAVEKMHKLLPENKDGEVTSGCVVIL